MSGEQANLGLATTRELLDEIRARVNVDYSAGGGGLDYTTVGGRPALSTEAEPEPVQISQEQRELDTRVLQIPVPEGLHLGEVRRAIRGLVVQLAAHG